MRAPEATAILLEALPAGHLPPAALRESGGDPQAFVRQLAERLGAEPGAEMRELRALRRREGLEADPRAAEGRFHPGLAGILSALAGARTRAELRAGIALETPPSSAGAGPAHAPLPPSVGTADGLPGDAASGIARTVLATPPAQAAPTPAQGAAPIPAEALARASAEGTTQMPVGDAAGRPGGDPPSPERAGRANAGSEGAIPSRVASGPAPPLDLLRSLGLGRPVGAAPEGSASGPSSHDAPADTGASATERATASRDLPSLLQSLRAARGTPTSEASDPGGRAPLPGEGRPSGPGADAASRPAEGERTARELARTVDRSASALARVDEAAARRERISGGEGATALERAIVRAEERAVAGGGRGASPDAGSREGSGAPARELPLPRTEPAPGAERSGGLEVAAATPAEDGASTRPAEGAARVPVSRAPDALAAHVQRLAEGGGGTARIRLDPPNLGELTLQVTVRGQSVDVRVVAREAAAQVLLEGGRDQLSDALASRELRMEGFDVSGGSRESDREAREGRDAGARREPGARPDGDRPARGRPAAEATPLGPPPRPPTGDDRVDLVI